MKTLELLNKVVELGFDREKALADIDASLDDAIGVDNRKPLAEEEVSEELASDILYGFRCEIDESKISNNTMDAIAALMDDETRERVHYELAPCSNAAFLKRYCELEPDFEKVLKSEFSIELD